MSPLLPLSIFVAVSTRISHFLLLGIYRPGSQAETSVFFDELSSVFEQIATYRCPMVVCGDFNIHVDQTQDVHAERLSRLLQSFDCRQHVTDPTHTGGHTLDLYTTRADTFIRDLCVGDAVSDHAIISFMLEGAPNPRSVYSWFNVEPGDCFHSTRLPLICRRPPSAVTSPLLV